MRAVAVIGLFLVLAGVSAIAVPYITYTEKEHVAEIGPIKAEKKEETKHFPISQIAISQTRRSPP